MAENTFDNWERFLNPDKLKQNLIQASLYLSAYETLKSTTIDQLKDFYTFEWRRDKADELKGIISEAYKTEVIALHPKDEFHACCLWLVRHGALSQDDLNEIEKIRRHRNSIAHELTKYISSIDRNVNRSILQAMAALVRKIDLWWLKEVEIPTDPDFDAEKIDSIDWDGVIGLRDMSLQLMLSVFNGDDSLLRNLHAQFVDAWKQKRG